LHTLAYFEVFSHPLTAEEVFQFSAEAEGLAEVEATLQSLVESGVIFQFREFFQSRDDSSWVPRRLEQNQEAERFLPIARRMGRFIGGFPFIRGVCVSGSLSKHCMKADSDIDFFMITQPGRLWLARTLLILFKKIFLFNSHQYFCVNYFLDTEHLEIEEKNRFTATETVTLLPVYGGEWYEAFCRENGWARTQFPHFPLRPIADVPSHRRPFLKRTAEWLLNGRLGAWLDQRAMRTTIGFWQHKFKHLDAARFDVALKSRQYVSKHHPLHFQGKVLEAYERRVKELNEEHLRSEHRGAEKQRFFRQPDN
jgi:hypothetical protein